MLKQKVVLITKTFALVHEADLIWLDGPFKK
jgi:hypothetical protein